MIPEPSKPGPDVIRLPTPLEEPQPDAPVGLPEPPPDLVPTPVPAETPGPPPQELPPAADPKPEVFLTATRMRAGTCCPGAS